MAYTTIDDPQAHFQGVTYTGDGQENRDVTLPGDADLAPDFAPNFSGCFCFGAAFGLGRCFLRFLAPAFFKAPAFRDNVGLVSFSMSGNRPERWFLVYKKRI